MVMRPGYLLKQKLEKMEAART